MEIKNARITNRVTREGSAPAAIDFGHGQMGTVDAPPEFGGKEGLLNPETLFVGSVNSCLMLTLYYQAAVNKVTILSYEAEAEGTVERSEEKKTFCFSRVVVRARAKVAEPVQVDKVRRLEKAAERFCIVSASLETPVEFHLEVQT